jgi:hypothetical protein
MTWQPRTHATPAKLTLGGYTLCGVPVGSLPISNDPTCKTCQRMMRSLGLS